MWIVLGLPMMGFSNRVINLEIQKGLGISLLIGLLSNFSEK
jgi:hypothetical protein